MRRAVVVLLAVAVVAAVAVGLSQSRETGSAPAQGGIPTPAQARRALAGSPAALAALHAQGSQVLGGGPAAYRGRLRALRGHPAVVNFWGSWCGPCRLEFPILQRQAVRLGRTVAFLGVDVQDNRGSALAFLHRHPVPFPSYADPHRTILEALHAQGTPTTIFLSPAGHVSFIHQGPYESDADLARDVRRYAVRG